MVRHIATTGAANGARVVVGCESDLAGELGAIVLALEPSIVRLSPEQARRIASSLNHRAHLVEFGDH